MSGKISIDRWKQANEGETRHWNNIMSDHDLAEKEEGYYRHATVMFLQRDNPTGMVIDIGGGPLSLMLRHNIAGGIVVDPISITKEYLDRYTANGIVFINEKAETFLESYSWSPLDEVWMYNCLQHVVDPEFILDNLHKVGRVLRISEPTNTPVNTMHPHTFTSEWYEKKLRSISISGEYNRVDYDYPYCGGKWILRND